MMIRPFLVLALTIMAAALVQDPAPAKIVDEHVYIVPVGKVDKKVLEDLKSDMPGRWPDAMNVEIFPEEALAESAYSPSRAQYEADIVLDDIAKRVTIVPSTERVLIVTDADLYVPELNFVFGLADEKKGVTIISVARLKADAKLLRERALKEALHEVAHSRGVAHCRDPKCVMYFSNTLADTDRKKAAFCITCNRKLHQAYGEPLFKYK